MRVFVITGISSGLGASIVEELLRNNEHIIGIGRSFTYEQEALSKRALNQFQLAKCDLGDLASIDSLMIKVRTLLKGKYDEVIFINNAGIINPITKIGNFENPQDMINHINVNFTSSVMIINSFVDMIQKDNMNLHILNISSGAAERPIEGWGLYCSTKKATKVYLDVLNKENNKVKVKHIDPGIMNTKMQQNIRNSNIDDFPTIEQFRRYKVAGNLLVTDEVAVKVLEGYFTK